ncbi:MAG: ABC transporter ATP-binding protein [Candidatus Methylomirabilales bacterium]
MSAPLLTINGLSIQFSTIDGISRVLDQVNLFVREGETVGLVGETGCGKSITAKTVLGALPIPPARILEGQVLFNGQDLLTLDEDRRRPIATRQISYIPQDPMTSLNPTFTIGQQMLDLIRWKGKKRTSPFAFLGSSRKSNGLKAKAIELLERVKISSPEEMLDRYPVELSGGMRQRVLIALSLIGHPKLLIADEPTTALDVTIQKGIVELIMEKVREEHAAVLYITHNLGVARKLCERIYVMYAGTIVETAQTRDLLENPKHPYTRGLLQAIPRLSREDFTGISGRIPDYVYPPSGCRFHPRCPQAMEICKQAKPEWVQVGGSHWAACHLYPAEGLSES